MVGNAPPGITAALRDMARPGDRLLNPQAWGSWFEFDLPDLPVAIDSRIELFPPATWDVYENILDGGEGWQAQLTDWDPSIVVVAFRDPDFGTRLAAAGWRSVYDDEDGWIYTAPGR